MTTTPKPEPASDQSVKWLRDSWITDVPINHGSMIAEIPIRELQGLILRIEAGCARIREQAEEIAVFKQSIAGTYPVNAMCCDGHERILFYSDFETCPLCAALSKPEPGR